MAIIIYCYEIDINFNHTDYKLVKDITIFRSLTQKTNLS